MRFCLLLWICAAWLGQCHSKAVDPLTDAFLPTTRIIGAVSLQKRICDNDKIIPDAVSELINVDKDVYTKFMAKNLESNIKGLKNASEFYKKTKAVESKDLQKTLIGFGKLTELKKEESKLKKEMMDKAIREVNKGAEVARGLVHSVKSFRADDFEETKKYLAEIKEKAPENFDQKTLTSKIISLHTEINLIIVRMTTFVNYKKDLGEFLSLEQMGEAMKGAMTVVHHIKDIFDNFESIQVFDSIAPGLKEQMSLLRTNMVIFEKQVKSLESSENSLKLIEQLKNSKTKKMVSNGLPNGVDDLHSLENDLKSTWFSEILAAGKKTRRIEEGLKPIISTSKSLSTIENQKNILQLDSKVMKDHNDFKMTALDLVTLGKKAMSNSNAENTLGAMSPCVQQMAKTATIPDLSGVEVIDKYVTKVVENVKYVRDFIQSILDDPAFKTMEDDFKSAAEITTEIDKTTPLDEATIAWNKIKDLDLLNKYDPIWTKLVGFDSKAFKLNSKSLNAQVLSDALTAAENAKIFDAVKCLPATAGDIGDLINFGLTLDKLKGMESSLKAPIQALTSAAGLSKEVNKAIAELKKTKTESGTQLICNLPKDYPKTAAPLLVFGSLANNIVKIRNSESSILVVANSTGPVKAAAESVPDSSLVYNQANRKSLLDTLKSVKNVSDSIGKLGMESSDDLLEISKEIKNVKGFVMANSTILTKIADSLAQNSNPDVENASTDFKVVSNLDLDFSSSSKFKIRERDFEVLFNPLFPPELIVISAIDRKQLFDSVYPACSAKSSIFQLYKTDEEDGSKICTDTDEFRFTGNEGYQFDETIKIVKKNPCRSSSQCDSEEYCSTSRRCTKKSDACISWDNPKVKCHFHCPSSICVSIDPKEVYCCPKNATKELPSKTCHVDEDCGPKQFCRTNNFGMSNCAEKEKSEEDLIAPTLEEVHMSYRDLPLSNFRRDNKTCDIEILKKFKPGTAFCPGDLIPLGHEHKCFGSVIQDDSSGRCLHPAGFCLKGYCCLQVHAKKDKLPLKPYLSRVECDPDCPLPSDWLFGFCDPVKRKVAFIGEELLYAKKKFEDTAFRKPESCQLNKDCINQNVCVIIPRFNSTTKEKMSSFECWVNPLRPPTPPDIFKPSLKLLAYLGMILFFIFIDLYKGTPYVEDNED